MCALPHKDARSWDRRAPVAYQFLDFLDLGGDRGGIGGLLNDLDVRASDASKRLQEADRSGRSWWKTGVIDAAPALNEEGTSF